jgi:hypothetical protein
VTNRPSPAARLAIALSIGIVAGFYCHASISIVRPADDFSWYWLGARALIGGQDPYTVVMPGGAFHLDAPFVYPLTTAMVAVPFALWLSPAWAAIVFVGLGAALLAWGITREGLGLLPIFGSAPFFSACVSGQISPLLTAGALIPALGWLAPAKPNLGLATLAYRPSKWSPAGSILFIAASLLINPHWPREWLSALSFRSQADYGKGIPVTLMGGPVLLLALTRWRRPEARLLLVLACVPQTLMFYDQLPLWLIARTRLQSATLGIVSLTGLILANMALPRHPTHAQVAVIYWPMIFATCYLPVLAMVLREPNAAPRCMATEREVTRVRVNGQNASRLPPSSPRSTTP